VPGMWVQPQRDIAESCRTKAVGQVATVCQKNLTVPRAHNLSEVVARSLALAYLNTVGMHAENSTDGTNEWCVCASTR